MLSVLRFSRFGTGQFTKPVFLFSLIALTLSTIFATFILTGNTTPALRKFYLIELSYNTKAHSTPAISNLTSLISSDKGTKTFSTIRVGYRALCIDHSGDWECARDAAQLHANETEVGGDPLELVNVADIYRQKVSFSVPVWASVIALSLAWIGTAVACVPVIPVHPVFKKVAAGSAVCAAVALLGTMVLMNITSSAVATLVNQLGMSAINVHLGTANPAFGWTAFALTLLSAVGLSAVVIAEYTLEKTQERVAQRAEEMLAKGSGGRINSDDVREWKQTVDGFSKGGAGGKLGQGVSFATALMTKKKMTGENVV